MLLIRVVAIGVIYEDGFSSSRDNIISAGSFYGAKLLLFMLCDGKAFSPAVVHNRPGDGYEETKNGQI